MLNVVGYIDISIIILFILFIKQEEISYAIVFPGIEVQENIFQKAYAYYVKFLEV